MVKDDIELNIQSPSDSEDDHIQKALEILDKQDWINIEQFLQPWGSKRNTLVHLAAYRGNLDILKLAVDLGLYLYATDELGRWALHYAAGQGRVDVVRWLLEQSATAGAQDGTEFSASDQISLEDAFGMTALDLAEKGGHLDVVKLLMEIRIEESAHLASVRSSLRAPRRPHLSFNGGDYEEAIYGISGGLGDGFAPPSPGPGYNEPIYGGNYEEVISGGGLDDGFAPPSPGPGYNEPIYGNDMEPIYANIQYPEKDEFLEHWQVDPIHLAAHRGDLDTLRSATGLDRKDKLGKSALHYAAEQGHLEVVKYLVERQGISTERPNSGELSKLLRQDCFGMTPLHYAADKGHVDSVQYLVESFADGTREGEEERLTQLSLGDCSGKTPLHLAAKGKHLEIVKILVEEGANVDSRDKLGVPPILMAHHDVNRNDDDMMSRYENIVKFLISRDVSVCSFEPTTGWTVLHYAAKLNSQKATRWLSRYHASLVWNPGYVHMSLDTPVHVAATNNSNEALSILLKILSPVDIDLPNSRGLTPLHAAASTCNVEGVRILVDKGGSLAKEDHSGRTPIDILSEHKDELDVVELFTGILNAGIHTWERNDFNPILKGFSLMVLDFKVLGPKDELQMAVVSTMIRALPRNYQIPILQHPLVDTYITLKWSRLYYFYGSLLISQLLFAIFLSCYAIYLQEDSVASIVRWIIFFLAVLLLFYNTVSFFTKPKSYFKKCGNWLYTLCVVTTIVVAIHGFIYDKMAWWIPYSVSIVVPLIWIQTMLLAGRLSGWLSGWMVNTLIFPSALVNFLKVFLAGFLSIIVGFAFSFSILLHSHDEFSNPWKAFVKSVLMMTGEYDYGDLFGNNTKSIVHNLAANESEKTYGPMISRGIFLLFVILTSIVLMNLMIGLAVSDIQGLVKEGDFSRLLKQAEFIANCEQMATARIFQKCLVPRRLPKMLKSRLPEVFKAIPFSLRKLPTDISMRLIESLYIIGLKNQKIKKKPLATTQKIAR